MNLKSLGTKLNIAFLTVLVLPLALVTASSVSYFSGKIEEDALQELTAGMSMISWLVDHEAKEMEDLVRSRSTMAQWAILLEEGSPRKLEGLLSREASILGLDEILIVDREHSVKAHSPGGTQSAPPPVHGWFSGAALAGYAKSGLELIETEVQSAPGHHLLSITASAPLYDERQERIVGAIVMRRYISREKHFVTMAYNTLRLNMCVYASNRLVMADSLTLPEELKLMKPAAEVSVLGRGAPFREIVEGRNGYIALYQPVLNIQGEPIGAFMVKRDGRETVLLRRRVFIVASAIALLGLLLTAAVKMLIAKNILLPIAGLQRGTRLLAGGDYSSRLPEKSADEIGDLTRSFNRMAEALQQSHEKLEEYSRSLASSEALFRAVVEDQSELISRSMPDGTLIFANGAYGRCFNEEAGGRKEKNFWEHIYDEDKALVEDRLAFLSVENPVVVIEDRNVMPDGRVAWMQWVVRGIFDGPGVLKGYQSVGRDMTERRRVEESLRTLNEKLIEEHDQRKFLARKLMELLELDRQRIAMELHDHIGQVLTTLKMDLEILSSHLDESSRVLRHRIGMALEKSIQAMRGIKEIAYGLRPSVLDDLGLVPSINNLIDEIRLRTDVEFHFFHRNIPKSVAREKQIAIYRVVQEALNNVLKHAGAKKVFVNLVKRDDAIWLSVEDDGTGFDPAAAMEHHESTNSMGLLIMRERVAQVDGEVSLESRKGAGTHLLVEIPL